MWSQKPLQFLASYLWKHLVSTKREPVSCVVIPETLQHFRERVGDRIEVEVLEWYVRRRRSQNIKGVETLALGIASDTIEVHPLT